MVLAVVPGVFALQKNVFRQLPLYRFLEGQAVEDLQRQDQETYEKLVESNTRYLGKMVREENKDARVTPGITKTPQITESVKNELEVTETPKPGQDNTRAAVTEPPAEEETATAAAQVVPVPEIDLAPETLADYDYLMNHFFIVDSATETTAEQINAASISGRRSYFAKRGGATTDTYLSQPFTGGILRFKGRERGRHDRRSGRLSYRTSFRNIWLSGDACDGEV